ncbi:uncharacterized protein LOC113352273 [Papaver somniferum]|uniref:uncharacterized protein LOC113352273 n=1 Tax=Papaver somniferum TaxID=3469 RepID=UPI000E6FCA57|nr:uncharacterized protein LOC113352273 [Papaver somniferum]
MARLLNYLDSISFTPDDEDELLWLGHSTGQFTVKEAYSCASASASTASFPRAKIWSNKWPHKIGFFLWQVALDRLPTLDNLHKRNNSLFSASGNPVANICPMCHLFPESSAHIFLFCSFAKRIWSYFFEAARLNFSTYSTTLDLINDWSSSDFSGPAKELWSRLYTSIMWSIWVERNERSFNKKEKCAAAIILEVKLKVFSWSRSVARYLLNIAHTFINHIHPNKCLC